MGFIDLTGQRFGRLTVVKRVESYRTHSGDTRSRYLCRCDCGEERTVLAQNLKRGKTQSCGCWRQKSPMVVREKAKTEGLYDIDGYIALANAIIGDAAREYKSLYRATLLALESESARKRCESVKRFFFSPWYRTLTTFDGEVLIEKLEREVLDNFKKKGK